MNKPVERKKVLVVLAGLMMSVTMSWAAQGSLDQGEQRELPQYREKAEVEVTVGGKKEKLKANRFGMYPRVYMGASEVVEVQVEYPGAKAGEAVDVQVEDGGQIVESGSIVYQGQLKAGGKLDFHFQTTQQLGIYRVVLRKGEDIKQLDFWVGSPQPQGEPVKVIPKFGGQ
jgi:hypothetical protein